MLLSEIRYSILNTAKGGGIRSDDSRLQSRLVDYWIQYYRNSLIPEITDFGKLYYPELVQDLGCVVLNDVDQGECLQDYSLGSQVLDSWNQGQWQEDLEFKWGCTIKKATIPALVDLPKERSLTFVGSIDKQTPFEIITAEQASLVKHRLITSVKPRAYRIGTSIYVIAPKNKRLKFINVRGIFEDPTKVESCAAAGDCSCFDPDTTQYPFPDTLMPKMVEMIMKKELGMSLQVPIDMANDSVELLENVGTQKQRQR